MTDAIQWAGCALGVLGSFLLATNSRFSGYGFLAFLGSNAMWITYGLMVAAPALIVMQAAFTLTSLLGVYRWLLPSARKSATTFARESGKGAS